MSVTIEQYIETNSLGDLPRPTDCTTMQELFVHPEMTHECAIIIADRLMSHKDIRLFACWCARQVWHLLEDDRSKGAVEVAERYAVGEATDEELNDASAAAYACSESYTYPYEGAYASAASLASYVAALASAPDSSASTKRTASTSTRRSARNACVAYTCWTTAYVYCYPHQRVAAEDSAYAAAADAQLKQLQTYTLTDEMR